MDTVASLVSGLGQVMVLTFAVIAIYALVSAVRRIANALEGIARALGATAPPRRPEPRLPDPGRPPRRGLL